MARKRHTPDEIVAKLRQVDVLTAQGQAVADAIRAIGVSEVTYYRWRQEFGGLKADQVKRLKALEQENARLREQVRIEQERPWKLLGADVSARTPDGGRRVVLLAAGSQQGVKPGMAVIGKEGSSPPALIGVVENVGPRSASVLLITDFSSSISAQVYHDGGVTTGVVQGQWQVGSRLMLEGVERADPLLVGDVVVTAGLTAQMDVSLPRAAIPKDIPIGIVGAIQVDGHSQRADVRPYVDPDRVSYAWVLLSQDE
jgi:rod shape-determining protein MreC